MIVAVKDNVIEDKPSRAFKDCKFAEAKKSHILLQLSFTFPPESFMERVQDTCKGSIACDIMLVWRSIADGVTAQTARTRDKYWRH